MSTKYLSLLLLVISCRAASVADASDNKKPAGLTTYDQRQTGKYNVHVNIKDVQFFSVSDSLAGIGGDYEDYGGDYDILDGKMNKDWLLNGSLKFDYKIFTGGDTDTDYDSSHLTVNPIFAFLGIKTTTSKPTTLQTVTEKVPAPETSSTSEGTSQETSTQNSSTSINAPQQEAQESEVSATKPATAEENKKPQANDTIDYEEIPVEVQYYHANHQKLPLNRQHAINRFQKRPSVVVIDGHGRTNNVKIVENERSPTVKICNRGEFRDNMGRCRVRARRGAVAPAGL